MCKLVEKKLIDLKMMLVVLAKTKPDEVITELLLPKEKDEKSC